MTLESISCFKYMILAFSSAPFLKHFDFALRRIIQVDSSAHAISAILLQPNEKGRIQPVCFYSKKLNSTEKNWQTHDQELGAIVFTFKEWRLWLMGANDEILVYSDHANLKYFMDARVLTPRQSRWAAFLSAFNFSILHLPGRLNPTDLASRRPDFIESSQTSESIVLFKSIPARSTANVSVIKLNENEMQFDVTFSKPSDQILSFIQAGYKEDQELKTFKPSQFCQNYWWLRGKLYVPLICRNFILNHYHAHPTVGHWGIAKTLDLVSRTFAWPNLRADILDMVKFCESCQKVNRDLRPPQGCMMPLSIPGRPWSTSGVDFIVKLPFSSGFDSIMVVVDHYSKGAQFIPAKESWTASQLADAFVKEVFRLHGLPDKLVSDRGTTFMSIF